MYSLICIIHFYQTANNPNRIIYKSEKMLASRVFLLSSLLVGCSLWCGVQCTCGDNPPGPNDCIATLNITSDLGVLLAPPGVVCIQCTFNGVPATDATFQLDNGAVDPEDGVTVNGVLVVCDSEQVFSTSSSTDLSCTSGVLRQQSIFFLEIFRAPMITGVTTVNESNTLTLDCGTSNSRPNPGVAWFNPEEEMVSGSRALMIENITRNATGTYSCVASESGTTMTSSVTVTVQFAPDVTADRQDLVDVPLGSTLQLTCSLLGVPPPDSVTWTHNGTTLNDADSDITISSDATSTSLSRTNVADTGGGQYECSASNVVGSNSDSTEVRVQLPPGPPTILMVTNRTTTTLTISWSNPDFDGFSPIASFRVQVMWEGADFNRTFAGDAGTTQFTVVDLRPFTEHTLRLFVSNAVMLEGESAEVVGTTVSLKLPVVQNADASFFNSTAITVEWEGPSFEADTTAPVQGYTLLYMPASGGSTTTLSFVAFGNDMVTATVKELEKGTNYTFSIIARNSAGEGATLTLDPVQTEIDPPSAPLSFTEETPDPFTIILSWVEPDDNGGRPVTGYELFISDVTPAMVELTSNDLSHRFDNLNENTSYMLAILAVNSADLRSPNATLTVTTPPVGPPQVPPNLAVDTITNVSAIARWDEAGGFPNFYIFQIKRRLEEWSDGKSVNLTSDIRYYDLTELDPLSTYDTRVQSQNLNGLSEFSAVEDFITFGDIEIDGPAQNETVVSGLPVTLNCQLQTEGPDDDPIVYTWTKEDGFLPEGSTQEANGDLLIPSAQEEDSGVYFCSANGVTGRFVVNIEDPPEPPKDDSGVSTTVIIIAAAVGGVALIIFLVVVFLAVFCLCCMKSSGGQGPHKRTYSFRPKHWADASTSHSLPHNQQRKDVTSSFHMPEDYTGHSSFNTADPVRRSPSPPSYSRVRDHSHAGAEPTTSFQLTSDGTDL